MTLAGGMHVAVSLISIVLLLLITPTQKAIGGSEAYQLHATTLT